ncbi:PDZ domain-containing protein [Kaistella flava (ex Peng et al. 2021)]|uniref:PDZ domain-containing protein n=1 Tax=Kaistella flava (ex Peng et al. 2021) TaxID=2038776 RepID=A0A7M2YAF7_9FLAO|nr:trypsin-like peptidase domain-containing protein [Kaistella flava (ex Peng et al. 2021)]QOW10809.1 PDZ domain-containing protein [Kaistella flava (ex Peng et al. 2021)]
MRNTLKKLIPYAVVGVMSGATTVGAFTYFNVKNHDSDFNYFAPKNSDAKYASFNMAGTGDDFVKAAKMTVPAVVSIKNFSNKKTRGSDQDIFDQFFGNPFGNSPRQQQPPKDMPTGMGSGVIISPDGYIISNNHVIAGATKLEVVLSNKKSYVANLVGTDPTTDIALLKIEEKGLPYLNFANSDNTEVGQWVLAVGNPMGLNSTVTAGIISAKGRSIDLLSQQSKSPIESFIQTDAAINPGNSGGALVNPNGELIGINSAISSKTGYYEGYGFAVPSNLARKVVEDIKQFGLVQRGFLGVVPLDLSDERSVAAYNQQKKTNLKTGDGVYLIEVADKGGAEDAGLRTGDIITKVDNTAVSSYYDLSFAVGSKRPGDKVAVTYLRNGKLNTINVTLKDQQGKTSLRSKADLSVTEKIGSEFEPLSEKFKTDYGLTSGVVARNVQDGSEMSKIGVVDNYIVIEVNGKPVNSQKDIEKILQSYNGNVQIKYVDEYGRITTRGFKMP